MTAKVPAKINTCHLLNNEESLSHGSINGPENNEVDPSLKHKVKTKLYISHMLYVWNSRVYEFAIVLFIVNLYPNTLLPTSLFALTSAASGIFLTNTVTKLVNHGERLSIIRKTIFIQRFFAILASSLFLIIFHFFQHHELLKAVTLSIVIVCGVVEKLCTIGNKISISRDWIVKISSKDQDFLMELNTKLRSIDLFSKLVGPFFISTFLTLTNHEITAIFLIFTFLISNQIEYQAILDIYHTIPTLKASPDTISRDSSHGKFGKHLNYLESIKLFLQNPLALAILSLSIIYFTVLSFGSSTIAYLLSFPDVNNFSIGVLKGLSTVFELFGTVVIFPFLSKRIQLVNTGLVSIAFQFLSLVPIALAFIFNYDKTHWLMCLCIPFSRVGLWCFDLTVQNSIQLFIDDDFERFNVTGFEETLNNFFALLGYASTLIFHRPDQFKYPVYATIIFIGVSLVLYLTFFIRVKTKQIRLA